jgi:hypothetical protein
MWHVPRVDLQYILRVPIVNLAASERAAAGQPPCASLARHRLKATCLPGEDKIRADVTISLETFMQQETQNGAMGRVRGGTRSPPVVVHPRTGDLSPLQANTTRASRARDPQAERGGSTGPPDRSRHVTCGNDEDGQPGWSRRPGLDCGSRLYG